MSEQMPNGEPDGGGLTLGALACMSLDERFRWFCADISRLDAIDSSIERARNEQGLEAPILCEDVAHAFAWNLPDLARHRSRRSDRFDDLWTYFECGGQGVSPLNGLVWSVACEQRTDWHPQGSRLGPETALAAFQRFETCWLGDGLCGADFYEEFYEPHWGPEATDRYLGLQHPAERIQVIARSRERAEREREREQAARLDKRVRASGLGGCDAVRPADLAPKPRADRIKSTGGGALRACVKSND
jgi:hypothetical protein